jgi:hypothetical protein
VEGEWKKDKKMGEEREESVCRMSLGDSRGERSECLALSILGR